MLDEDLGSRGTFYAIIKFGGGVLRRLAGRRCLMDAIILSAFFRLETLFMWFFTAQAPYEWGWRMHPMWGWGWGVGMMGMMLLFWGVAIFAGVTGIRWFVNQTKQTKQPRADPAMEILRERFARGEIEKDEFEAKKKELS
jgi:putative membrane protein